MTLKRYITLIIFGIFSISQASYAQEELNTPNDDLGNVTDEFQEYFFEALKQKAIENYDKSVTALLKCIEIDDSESVLYFELGKNYNLLKNFGEAEEALKEAVSKEPDNEWYLDELYAAYVHLKDYRRAIKTVKQLVKFHPDYKEDLAAIYVQTQNYKDALDVLDELDEELGLSSDRDQLRNRIYKATGRKKEQIENLKDRVDKDPAVEKNYLALIYRYSENNDEEKAYETAKTLLEIHPESQLVHLALYKFYLNDNKQDEAIASMKTVLGSKAIAAEAKVKVLADFVRFVSENQQYENELVAITSQISQTTTNAKTLIELAQYYLVKNNKPKALEYYLQAEAKEPENFGLIRNILLLHIDLKQYQLAQEKSAQALERFPSQPVLYLINGVSLNQLERNKEAVETLEMGFDYIIENAKMEADFYKQLTKAHTALNNLKKAQAFSDKAKSLEPLE
ncbi:tetratricopeptide repeat protein [Bizionia gelidisalsuginis]|uniref:Tetratricopeptide repeat protein n=1 Tax=Bizionia gelidisalsuginis TaxID=291188 RepID=A0ABY3MCY0_9FLAO|nr:tetratricopeptide repeat protein [Bizionia gelidisalsuginis]TYC15694.1 tetratricopeptide repeat protein [Bizionia gelidisalsuginis]